MITAHELLSKSLSFSNYLYELTKDKTIVLKEKPVIKQERTISGTITDEKGAPLLGVTILVQRHGNPNFSGTTTNLDGQYQIAVEKGDIISFSHVGFIPQKITIENQTTINIVMKVEASELEEVIIVGYGETSKERLTGAVNKINTKVLQTTQNVSFADALIGVVPGLLVQERFFNPDTPPSILLRGVGSINAKTAPLIIIDGVQMPAGFGSSALNGNDIEEMSILKDAAATSIYGSRGANGVILVTTKKGRKNSKLRVSFNTRSGFKSPDTSFTDDIMNTTQKLDYEKSLGLYDSNLDLLRERRNSGNNINWSDLLIDTEVNHNHDIAIRALHPYRPRSSINSDFKSSTQFLQNAAYVKLKNLVIGYTLNENILSKIGIDHLRIFVQAQNIFTITDVDYIDPEFATATGDIDLSSAINRGLSLGINANF
ncbi:MAG: TonB-dependent receptor plug domain-containing protein [Jejuia sp.]